ncbi:sensor histidine kinase [Arcobacter suis]|uniref:histidine kinase n=2 Tax=Arcobacter suis TaxID=1278212 RepID=A0AAD0SQI6_9BACT|nr:PAS domain-containing sensor histidine kinase [Arcobacter suis]AXX89602.1 PAS sensor-containing signal transduction histidine kinase [Arcobacter suis CECT 7833]
MKYKGSIKRRLIIIIMSVTLITSFTGYATFLYWYMNNQQNKTVELAQTVGLVLGQDIVKLVLLNDVSFASDITSKLKSFSTLESMVLYKLDEKPVFQYSKDNKSFIVEKLPSNKEIKYILNSNLLKLYINANYQDTHLGFIELNFKIDTIINVIKKDIKALIIILFFMFIVSYILAHLCAKDFTNPILNLVKFLEKIDLVDFIDKRVISNQKNEFGKLYDEVNLMLDRMESSYEAQKIAAVAFETQSGMTITDKNQRILKVNKAFEKITGYTQEEVIGKTPALLKSGLHDREFYFNLYKTLQKDGIWIGEIKNKHKNGNIYNEHLIIQSVLDSNNEPIYYVASFLDITKQKLTEEKLTQREKLLIQQSKMAQMGEMLENIAHQWRQPLSVITTSATGLKVQQEFSVLTNEELIESLDSIVKAAVHLSVTIDDFRNFYKNDKEKKSFNLRVAVEKSLTLLSSKFKNQEIEIKIEVEDIEIYGFENELIQVFINILNNAKDELVKQDNQNRLIYIFAKKEKENISISFQDNAGGIKKELLAHIFENHFTTKEQEDGTGIGLYMSKLIIDKINGEIKASNEMIIYNNKTYEGAKFNITIPLD